MKVIADVRRLAAGLSLALTMAAVPVAADATPIIYRFSGYAAGKVGTDSYAGNFVLELLTDTDKVLDVGPPTDSIFAIVTPGSGSPAAYARMTIDGYGVVNITESVRVQMFPHQNVNCLCILVGAARNGASPQLFDFRNVAGIDQYDMRGEFGPVTTRDAAGTDLGAFLRSDHGNLDFSGGVGGPAVFSATLVPVPAAGWLFASAVTAMLGAHRRLLVP